MYANEDFRVHPTNFLSLSLFTNSAPIDLLVQQEWSSKNGYRCFQDTKLSWLTEPCAVAPDGAPESASSQRGESPLQENALRPVTECNCDAAMRSGEQQEVNDQSIG